MMIRNDTEKPTEWLQMNPEERKRSLYLRQKKLLNTLLEHGAISQAQYNKSLGDLTRKMGMEQETELDN